MSVRIRMLLKQPLHHWRTKGLTWAFLRIHWVFVHVTGCFDILVFRTAPIRFWRTLHIRSSSFMSLPVNVELVVHYLSNGLSICCRAWQSAVDLVMERRQLIHHPVDHWFPAWRDQERDNGKLTERERGTFSGNIDKIWPEFRCISKNIGPAHHSQQMSGAAHYVVCEYSETIGSHGERCHRKQPGSVFSHWIRLEPRLNCTKPLSPV